MFDVGGGELILIILAILLLFGPEKLPEFTKTITKGMRKVKQAQTQFQNQINEIQSEVNKTLDLDEKHVHSSDFKPIHPPDIEAASFDEHTADDTEKDSVVNENKNDSSAQKDS
jgi:sec-independent protein translocase protein TatA